MTLALNKGILATKTSATTAFILSKTTKKKHRNDTQFKRKKYSENSVKNAYLMRVLVLNLPALLSAMRLS